MPLYRREDHYDEEAIADLAGHYRALLSGLGEDADREGLIKTPERAAKALAFLTQGMGQDPAAILKAAVFEEQCEEMVLVRDIEVFSLCEHHMLPFMGKAHVAYIPQGRITGLSKIPRVVDVFARRLQVQERLTRQSGIAYRRHWSHGEWPWSSKHTTCACKCAVWRSNTARPRPVHLPVYF